MDGHDDNGHGDKQTGDTLSWPDIEARAGLRERKKLATRQALSSAALRLAIERGLENVTIEDITAEAGVSLRTFRNYFASKQEAIAALGAQRAARIGESLLARPAGEPLWPALTTAVLEHYEGTERAYDTGTMAALRSILNSPAMRGEFLKVNFMMQNALAAAIAQRTRTDVRADMYPQILAAAVTAASQVAVRHWYAADPPVPLRPILERALAQLASACGQPSPSRAPAAAAGGTA
jgi:AcrR family transcriptional regulator